MLFSLRIIPIPLLTLFIFSLLWCLNVNSSSRWSSNAFELIIDIVWLSSVKKIISLACFDGLGLQDIFHLLAQRPTLSRFLYSFCEVLIGSLTPENIEVSSGKSFTLASRLADKSLIYYIKKIMDQRIEPWGTLGLTVRFLSIQNISLLPFK